MAKKYKGIGDVVKKITNAIGMETCDKCEARRIKWNRMIPFQPDETVELTYEEIRFVNEIHTKVEQRKTVKADEVNRYESIYNMFFKSNRRVAGCFACLQDMAREFKKILFENDQN